MITDAQIEEAFEQKWGEHLYGLTKGGANNRMLQMEEDGKWLQKGWFELGYKAAMEEMKPPPGSWERSAELCPECDKTKWRKWTHLIFNGEIYRCPQSVCDFKERRG